MVEVDPATPVIGAAGEVPLIDTFTGLSDDLGSTSIDEIRGSVRS
jgi:hypothetical protein